MNFKLSQETKSMLVNSPFYKTNKAKDYKGFHKKHHDLAPRNIYLREGRVMPLNDVKKAIENIDKKSFAQKILVFLSDVVKTFKSS